MPNSSDDQSQAVVNFQEIDIPKIQLQDVKKYFKRFYCCARE